MGALTGGWRGPNRARDWGCGSIGLNHAPPRVPPGRPRLREVLKGRFGVPDRKSPGCRMLGAMGSRGSIGDRLPGNPSNVLDPPGWTREGVQDCASSPDPVSNRKGGSHGMIGAPSNPNTGQEKRSGGLGVRKGGRLGRSTPPGKTRSLCAWLPDSAVPAGWTETRVEWGVRTGSMVIQGVGPHRRDCLVGLLLPSSGGLVEKEGRGGRGSVSLWTAQKVYGSSDLP